MAKAQKIRVKQSEVEEIKKCAKDPIYFINTYCKIRTTDRGTILFKTYPFQNDCIRAFIKHRFNIVLKSRQLGLSTVTAGYSLWKSIFQKDQNILSIATKKSTALTFLNKIKKMIEGLPEFLKFLEINVTKEEIVFSNGSTIKSIPTSEDAGRSETLSLLVVDEAAFIRNFDVIWTGLYPTLSTGGEAIIISTPNGVGGQYHEIWSKSERKENDFNAIKLPWTVHPEHDQVWYEKQIRQMNKQQAAQELLCEFLSSGDTFLSAETMTLLLNNAKTPSAEGPKAQVHIWQLPESGKKYLISADVSRGDAEDNSAFHIFCIDTGEVIGEYCGKIRPEQLALLLAEYGKRYNMAMIVVEQNTFGFFTNTELKKMKYPNLFYAKMPKASFNSYVAGPEENPGFHTTSESRPRAINKMGEMLRSQRIRTNSMRLYSEFQTFVWMDNKCVARKGEHDDLIMSLAIGCDVLDSYFFSNPYTNTGNTTLKTPFSTQKRSYDVGGHPMSPGQRQYMNKMFGPVIMTTGNGKVEIRQSPHVDSLDWLLK